MPDTGGVCCAIAAPVPCSRFRSFGRTGPHFLSGHPLQNPRHGVGGTPGFEFRVGAHAVAQYGLVIFDTHDLLRLRGFVFEPEDRFARPVGQHGGDAVGYPIAGVSLGTPIFTLMIALGDIFGVGGSSVISRLFGKKEYEDGRRISVFCFYAAIAVGIVVSIILLAAKQPILGLLGCDETTWQYAGDYYQWIALGAPFIILQLTPNNLLRTEGFAKASMIGTMLGAVVNIILDPIFIYTLGMGAAGAAIATVIGNICGDIFYVIFMIKKCRYLSVDFRKLKVTGAEVLAVLAIGIPASVTNFMQSIGVTLTNRFLQPYGTDKVAAMGIALKIIMISVLVMVGFAFGGQPLVGYNYGAKNKKRLSETIRFAFLLEVLTGAGMAVVLGAAAPLLVGLFLKEADVIAVAQQILRVQLIGMPFVGIVLASTCIFQAIGNGAGAMILSAGRQGVIFAIVIFCASKLAGFSGVIASQPVSDFLTALVAVMILLQWKKKEFAK